MSAHKFHTTASFAELVGIAKDKGAKIGVSRQGGITTVTPRDKYSEEIVKETLGVLGIGWWHI